MQAPLPAGTARPAQPSWQEIVAKYQAPDLRRSLWQVATTFIPFFGLLFLMYASLAYPYWLTLLLAVPTGGLLIRIFVILHDCGHGSFFRSMRANNMLGTFCGLLSFVPYNQWRFSHAIHHATAGDLDRRGTGDVVTWTVAEYLERPWHQRWLYRLLRHPLFLFTIAPMIFLLIHQRLVSPSSRARERHAVYIMNLTLLATIVALSLVIGLKALALIYLPVLFVGGTAIVYGFYVQHQFEGVYWQRHGEWDYLTAALEGSSYFKLPKVLQWFSGNIGLHHVHHLSSRIPNYNLQRCHDENPIFHDVTTITLWSSLKTIHLSLLDEETGQLVRFKDLKTIRNVAAPQHGV
jgi:acyl-lipid omega-6 desaturase (Delta-12 desaturase)